MRTQHVSHRRKSVVFSTEGKGYKNGNDSNTSVKLDEKDSGEDCQYKSVKVLNRLRGNCDNALHLLLTNITYVI